MRGLDTRMERMYSWNRWNGPFLTASLDHLLQSIIHCKESNKEQELIFSIDNVAYLLQNSSCLRYINLKNKNTFQEEWSLEILKGE